MTNTDVIENLIPLYESLMQQTDDIKSVLDSAKEAGLDHRSIASVAKAKAASKLNDLKSKIQALQTVLNEVN